MYEKSMPRSECSLVQYISWPLLVVDVILKHVSNTVLIRQGNLCLDCAHPDLHRCYPPLLANTFV